MTVIDTVEDLEERLSRPPDPVVRELSALDGDLLILGAGGKMGPALARMAARALEAGGAEGRVVAVSRFSDPGTREALEAHGVATVACDLASRIAVESLPDAAQVVFLAGTKFGTSDAPALTWIGNAVLPAVVAERFASVPAVVLSSGNVYPLVAAGTRGATESTPPAPIGEYAWSVLARERVFEHWATVAGTPVTLARLSYANDLRYGVLVDIAERVRNGEPIDLSMGWCNVIWQGDANAWILRCLAAASTPPAVLNVAGPERASVRELAVRFGRHLGREPILQGSEAPTALLADATAAVTRFGPPAVSLEQLLEWTAHWVGSGRPTLGKPTRYEVRDGTF